MGHIFFENSLFPPSIPQHLLALARHKRLKTIRLAALVAAIVFSIPTSARASDDREVVTRVKAVYPEMAKRMKITGTVLLHATVEPNGKVKAVNLVMGESLLVEAAKEAVLHWKFAPAERESVEDVEVEF
jgi:TonB family protein